MKYFFVIALLLTQFTSEGIEKVDSLTQIKNIIPSPHTYQSSWITQFGQQFLKYYTLKVGFASFKPECHSEEIMLGKAFGAFLLLAEESNAFAKALMPESKKPTMQEQYASANFAAFLVSCLLPAPQEWSKK